MSDEDIVAKFQANADGVISSGRQQQIIDQTWSFDEVADLEGYMQLFVQDV